MYTMIMTTHMHILLDLCTVRHTESHKKKHQNYKKVFPITNKVPIVLFV